VTIFEGAWRAGRIRYHLGVAALWLAFAIAVAAVVLALTPAGGPAGA